MKKLINGNIIEIDDVEKIEISNNINNINNSSNNLNEPLDRSRITEDIKQDLKNMVIKYPETKVLLQILLGNSDTESLLKG